MACGGGGIDDIESQSSPLSLMRYSSEGGGGIKGPTHLILKERGISKTPPSRKSSSRCTRAAKNDPHIEQNNSLIDIAAKVV